MTIIQPHIYCRKGDISNVVLLPGDPARAVLIGNKYLNGKIVAKNREFTTYTGYYKRRKISVTSTGIGCPSTAIATEELINIGAKILIRVGTCGGALKRNIPLGSIIIPTASVREEGTTKEYLPPEFPAVADFSVTNNLINAAQRLNYKYFVGIDRTHDAFYARSEMLKNWGKIYQDQRMKNWDYPLISSQMECSVIFLISLIRGIRAGAVLAVNAEPRPLKEIVEGKYNFITPKTKSSKKEATRSEERAIITALEASVLF